MDNQLLCRCGAQARIKSRDTIDYTYYWVQCKCGMRTITCVTDTMAVKIWSNFNNREIIYIHDEPRNIDLDLEK